MAETDHHDLWQRSTLSVALVGRERGTVDEGADAVRRFTESRLGTEYGASARSSRPTTWQEG